MVAWHVDNSFIVPPTFQYLCDNEVQNSWTFHKWKVTYLMFYPKWQARGQFSHKNAICLAAKMVKFECLSKKQWSIWGEGKERKQVVCFVVVQKTEGGGWISPSTHILKSGLLYYSETQKSGSYSGYNHAGYISPNIKQNCFFWPSTQKTEWFTAFENAKKCLIF